MDANKIPEEYRFTLLQQVGNTTTLNNVFTAWLPESFSYSQTANYEAPFLSTVQGLVGHAARMFGYNIVSPVMTAQLWMGSETPEFNIEVSLETETDPILDIKTPFLNLLRLVTPSLDNNMLSSPGPSLDVRDMISAYFDASTSTGETASNVKQGLSDTMKKLASDAGTTIQDKAKAYMNTPVGQAAQMKDTSKHANDYSPLQRQYWTNTGSDGTTKISNQISIKIGRYIYFPSVVITSVESELMHIINGATGFPMSATVSIGFRPLFSPTVEDFEQMFP